MEFIELFMFFINFSTPAMEPMYGFSMDAYVALITAACIYLVLYALKAAALFTMAKKRGLKKLYWCAFVPFASTYLMGEIGGELKFGNARFKHLGIYAMIAEILYVACSGFVYGFYAYAFHNGLGYYEPLQNVNGNVYGYTWGIQDGVLSNGMYVALTTCEIAGYILNFLTIIAFIFVNIALFRRYTPSSYIWMVVLCALLPPLENILLFAFCRRTPIDYDKYMRARMDAMRRQQQYGPYGPYGPYGQNPYGQNQNPYGQNQNPYGQNQNPYGQNNGGSQQGGDTPPEDPFGEFSDKKGNSSGGQSGGGGSGDDFFS